MKRNLIALVIATVATLGGISKATAQTASKSNSLEYQTSLNEATNSTISARALKNFAGTYKNVRGESWMKIKDGFSVRFRSDNIMTTIFYDRKGYWTGSIKIYSEEKMLHEVRHTVKSVFYDYKIVYTQEIETTDSKDVPTYIVCLEDKTNIKLVRINDGEMSIWKEYAKAN